MSGLGPNAPCWCRSGRKYKHCHRNREQDLQPGVVSPMREVPPEIERPPYIANGGMPPSRTETMVKPPEMIERMRVAGAAAGRVLDTVAAAISPGVTTDALDAIAHDAYLQEGGYPSPLGYRGYPKSVCTSVNEVICHGIPDDRVLLDGDILNVDVTIYLDGVHGDTNATFPVGTIDDGSRALLDVTRECLERAILAVRAGAELLEIGRAIQTHAESSGFGVVRTFCGHGIGTVFHGEPSVPHYEDARSTLVLESGMTFTIEPMITMGSWRERIWSDEWTAVTVDGLRTAQYEHTLVVTDDGAEVLTPSKTLPAPLPTPFSSA